MTKKLPEGWTDPVTAEGFAPGMSAMIDGKNLIGVRDNKDGSADVLLEDGTAFYRTDIVIDNDNPKLPTVQMTLTAPLSYESTGKIELQDE